MPARSGLLRGFVLVACLLVLGGLVTGRDRLWEMIAGPPDLGAVDFATLEPGPHPNHVLVCPPGHCRPGVSDLQAPAFAVPADRLSALVAAVAAEEPRTERVDDGSDPLRARYVVRSRVMRFPDTVSVEAVPLGDGRSTLAIYGRAQLGTGDFGVNRKRVERWLGEIEARARQAPAG